MQRHFFPSDEEYRVLHDVVEELYRDRILPEEKTVKARLQLRFDMNGPRSLYILQNFVELYRRQPAYQVDADVNGLITIKFKNGFYGFKGWVNPCSDEDTYPSELWEQFSLYLQELLCSIKESNGTRYPFVFHRGRYGMAQELCRHQLPFFRGLSLGEVCHVVELAIQKKLLAYEDNMLLPASACASLTNALLGRPTVSATGNFGVSAGEYILDLEELKRILGHLLQRYPDGFNLSTLKTKIKGIFQKRLSETVFHQTKLLDLMHLSPLTRICKIVKLQGNCGYLVQPNWDNYNEWAIRLHRGNGKKKCELLGFRVSGKEQIA